MASEITEKNKKSIRERNSFSSFFPFFFVFIMLISFYPYEFYSAFPAFFIAGKPTTYAILFILTIVLTAVFQKRPLKVPFIALLVVIMQTLAFLLCDIMKGRAVGLGVFMAPLLALSLVYFLDSTCGLVAFFKKYNFWVLMMTSMGAISFFLVRFGVLSPLYPFLDLSDEGIMYNYGITFSSHDNSGGFLYCGFFDEPGAIAQWSIFALYFNKLFIKNNKFEMLLILTTLLSFSMGYYLQIFVYIVLFYLFRKKTKQEKITSVVIIGAIGLALGSGVLSKGDINDRTIGRALTIFEDSKTNGLAVDDREIHTIEALYEFHKNPLWGTSASNVDVGHNIYEPLALYGIIGTIFLYSPFLIFLFNAILRRDIDLLRIVIVMILGFTHRPFHNNILSYFIVYSFLVMYYQSINAKKSFSNSRNHNKQLAI